MCKTDLTGCTGAVWDISKTDLACILAQFILMYDLSDEWGKGDGVGLSRVKYGVVVRGRAK